MPSMPATIHALMRSPAVCTPAGIRDQARTAVCSGVSGRSLSRAARIHGLFSHLPATMIELNPVRQRIADLSGRLHALRGFL